jgi:arylsulfatase
LSWLTALTLVAACTGESQPSRPNILVITIDSLRADHLGCYGYERKTSPNIDRLASEGVLFERAYTHAPFTAPSHASLMTSLHTKSHGVFAWAESLSKGAHNLSERFEPAGYRSGAFYNHPGLRTSQITRGFDVVQERFFEEAPKTTAAFLDWVDSSDQPFVSWVHLWDVHRPYGYRDWTPDFFEGHVERDPADMQLAYAETRFGEPVPPTTIQTGRTEAAYNLNRERRAALTKQFGEARAASDISFIQNRYDGGVWTADAGIGQLVAGLRERGLLDSTILVLTADHGESLTERDACFFTHDPYLFEETLHVPLIVRLPTGAHAGRRVEGLTRLVDVVPTLHELANVALFGDEQGQSLVPAIEGRATKGALLLAGTKTKNAKETVRRIAPDEDGWLEERLAISDGRFKAIHDVESDRWLLFDLEADLGELHDLSADPASAAELTRLSAAAAQLEASLPVAGDTSTELTGDLEELLTSTGYLGSE